MWNFLQKRSRSAPRLALVVRENKFVSLFCVTRLLCEILRDSVSRAIAKSRWNANARSTFVSLTFLGASNYSFDDRLLRLTVARVVLNTQRCVVERYNLLSYTTMKEVLVYVKHFLLRKKHIVIRSNIYSQRRCFSFKGNERCIIIQFR